MGGVPFYPSLPGTSFARIEEEDICLTLNVCCEILQTKILCFDKNENQLCESNAKEPVLRLYTPSALWVFWPRENEDECGICALSSPQFLS